MWVLASALPLACCVTLGRLLPFSGLSPPHLLDTRRIQGSNGCGVTSETLEWAASALTFCFSGCPCHNCSLLHPPHVAPHPVLVLKYCISPTHGTAGMHVALCSGDRQAPGWQLYLVLLSVMASAKWPGSRLGIREAAFGPYLLFPCALHASSPLPGPANAGLLGAGEHRAHPTSRCQGPLLEPLHTQRALPCLYSSTAPSSPEPFPIPLSSLHLLLACLPQVTLAFRLS